MVYTVAAVAYCLRHPFKARRFLKACAAPWPDPVVEADAILEAEWDRLVRLRHPSNGEGRAA